MPHLCRIGILRMILSIKEYLTKSRNVFEKDHK
jgi:hypothetical protein